MFTEHSVEFLVGTGYALLYGMDATSTGETKVEKNERVKLFDGKVGYVVGPRSGNKILIGYPDGSGETRDYFPEDWFRYDQHSKKHDWVQTKNREN